MTLIKISKADAKLTDLGIKKILSYPLPTRLMSVAHMTVSGRHPKSGFLLERDCAFCLYVIKGEGVVYADDDIFKVGVINDGTSRDGYAQYVCEVLNEYGFAGSKVWVQIIDIQKLTRTGKWERIGEARCR